MKYFRNIVVILLAAFCLYMVSVADTFFACAVIVIATGIILNKLDKIERCLKEKENDEQIDKME